MDIGLLVDAHLETISGSVDIVTTTGFHTLGKGIARYKRMASAPLAREDWGENLWWFQSADDAYWELAEDEPNLLQFGGHDDGVKASNYVITGTDNTDALNALLYYCQYRVYPTAHIPPGGYVCDDVIHLGFGFGSNETGVATYTHVNLKGAWPGYAAIDRISGTTLYSTNSDRPLLNIQGQRECLIEGILFSGLFDKYVVENNLGLVALSGDPEDFTPNDRDIDVWFDENLDANQDTQYTPYAAVTIDAYSGDQPATSYPDANYPEYAGIEDQWGKSHSSNINFRYCGFEGFIAGVASQPCDDDANGDFIRFDRCMWQFNKYCITIGNGQSRNVGLYDCLGNTNHTLLEGLTHGRKLGRFQGPIVNYSCSQQMQILNVSGPVGVPVTFYDCYFEGVDRIGNVQGASSGAVTFVGGYLAMDMPTPDNVRGTPPNHFNGSNARYDSSTVASTALRFIGTNLEYDGALVLLSNSVTIEGGRSINTQFDSEPTLESWQALANNALVGGIVTPNFGTRTDQAIAEVYSTFRVRDVDSGVPVGGINFLNGVWGGGTRSYGSPVYARKLSTSNLAEPVEVERKYVTLPKSWFDDLTLDGRTLTATFTQAASHAEPLFVVAGDVMYDDQTGMTFFIESFNTSNNLITATLMNGYRGPEGDETTVVELSDSEGTFITGTGRVYTPAAPLYVTNSATRTIDATVTNGSAKATDIEEAYQLLVGLKVTGTGIPADTYCIGVSGSTVMLSNAATSNGTSLTFGTSSAVLNNVGDITGYFGSGWEIEEGDFVGSNDMTDYLVNPNGGTITDIDTTARTITLSSPALWPPIVNRRIKALRLAPPA